MKYWQYVAILSVCIFLLACQRAPAGDNEKSMELVNTKTTSENISQEMLDSNNQLSVILPMNSLQAEEGTAIILNTAGLSNVVVTQKSVGKPVSCDEDDLAVYVLGDYQFANSVYHNSYLAVELGNEILLHNLNTKSLEDMLYLADIDADGLDEIILHQHLDDFGGAGTYLSRIYRVEHETICEVFNSYTSAPVDKENGIFDTGFTSKFLEGKKLKIMNEKADYQTVLDISEKYIDDFFDSSGIGKIDMHIGCDSFIKFIPEDVDFDGTAEIVGLQYIFLFNHAGGMGYGKTILKYNAHTGQFDIIEAEFLAEYPGDEGGQQNRPKPLKKWAF